MAPTRLRVACPLLLAVLVSTHSLALGAGDACAAGQGHAQCTQGTYLLQRASASRKAIHVQEAVENASSHDGANSDSMTIQKAVFENRCSQPIYVYGTQPGAPGAGFVPKKIEPGATEEYTSSGGFVPWHQQRLQLSFGEFYKTAGLAPPTGYATVVELNVDAESFVMKKPHVSWITQNFYNDLNMEIAWWKDRIGGTLAAEGEGSCFARAKTAFKMSDCNFPDGTGKKERKPPIDSPPVSLPKGKDEICTPMCLTGGKSDPSCHVSCFRDPGTPAGYAEYTATRSLAWRNGNWQASPPTIGAQKRKGGDWSATLECWDDQVGPVGFPICPPGKGLPDTVGVWQVVACPDGDASSGA